MPQAPKTVKKTICKFWLEGKCKSETGCTWAHGEDEIGQPIDARGFDAHSFDPSLDAFTGGREGARHGGKGGCPSCGKGLYGGKSLYGEKGGSSYGSPYGGKDTKGRREHLFGGKGEFAYAGKGKSAYDGKGPVFYDEPTFFDDGPPVPATKRTICKFWQKGECGKGDACTWAHGDEDIGSHNAGTPDDFSQWPPAQMVRHPVEYLPVGAPPSSYGKGKAPAAKRTICKFWAKGQCLKGADECTWAHGEEDVGTPTGLMDPPFDDIDFHGFHGQGFEFEPEFHQLGPRAVASGPPKRTICKFWLEGKCTKGDGCSWAHGDEDIGAPIVETQWAPSLGPGPEAVPPWRAMAAGHAPALAAHAWAEPFVRPLQKGKGEKGKGAGKVVQEKRSICKFWLEGKCAEGERCTWAHGEEDIGGGVQVPAPRREPGRVVPAKRTICKFWLEGKCEKGGECTWAHGEEDVGSATTEEAKVKRPRIQPLV